jgi:multidrug efflux system membrane fusion protein
VYVVTPDHTAEVRPVTVDDTVDDEASIRTGLSAGETVVVDGVDKLRAGSPVQVKPPAAATPGASAGA